MEIAVLVEPIPGKGYRARAGEPFALETEGATKEEALRRLRDAITSRMDDGAELTSVEIAATENPWISFAGMFRDDPLFDEWQAAIGEGRDRDE